MHIREYLQKLHRIKRLIELSVLFHLVARKACAVQSRSEI